MLRGIHSSISNKTCICCDGRGSIVGRANDFLFVFQHLHACTCLDDYVPAERIHQYSIYELERMHCMSMFGRWPPLLLTPFSVFFSFTTNISHYPCRHSCHRHVRSFSTHVRTHRRPRSEPSKPSLDVLHATSSSNLYHFARELVVRAQNGPRGAIRLDERQLQLCAQYAVFAVFGLDGAVEREFGGVALAI